MSAAFPRVLHVGHHPVGAPTNTGLTVGSMFEGWPAGSLFEIYAREHPAYTATTPALLLPPRSAPFDLAIQETVGRYGRWRRRRGHTVRIVADGMNNSVKRTHLSSKQRALLALQTLNDIAPVYIPHEVLVEARTFQPDVVHSLLGGVRQMRFALALSVALDLPLVPHFMDDWIDNLFIDGQLFGIARRSAVASFERILDRSPVVMVIGRDMAAEFEPRLGRECIVVGNSVDQSDFALSRPVDPSVMRYVGGLHLGRDAILRELATAMQNAPQLGQRIEIFAPTADRQRAEDLDRAFPFVTYNGDIPPSEVPRVLGTAGSLIFVESGDEGILRFTRLSVSTKVPQYLASGRPILAVGPEGQASVRELSRSEEAEVVAPGSAPAEYISAAARVAGRARSIPPADFAEWFSTSATRERLRDALSRASAVGLGSVARVGTR